MRSVYPGVLTACCLFAGVFLVHFVCVTLRAVNGILGVRQRSVPRYTHYVRDRRLLELIQPNDDRR